MPGRIGSHSKLDKLKKNIRKLESAVLCFSGGLDSSFLLWVCRETLNPERLLAVTFVSASTPLREIEKAKALADRFGVKQLLWPGPEMNNEDFLKNDLLRCYYCKRERFTFLLSQPETAGRAVLEGSVMDDLEDFRPGRAAIRERDILSPLLEVEMYKEDIRFLAEKYKLSFAREKPESCLATRIKTGQRIQPRVLKEIEQAERFIRELGIDFARVRWDRGQVCLETMENEMEKAIVWRKTICGQLEHMGFTRIFLDLQGYQPLGKRLPRLKEGKNG